MERPPVYSLEVYSDRALLPELLKGVLTTLFFHRLFIPLRALTIELLDLTLPSIDDPSLLSLLDTKISTLLRSLDSSSSSSSSSPRLGFPSSFPSISSWGGLTGASERGGNTGLQKGQMVVQFFERGVVKKTQRGVGGWFGGIAGVVRDERVVWEEWRVNVTVLPQAGGQGGRGEAERAKVRRQIEDQLRSTILKIITLAGTEKLHIPPIHTADSNPFPYDILITQKGDIAGGNTGGGAGGGAGGSWGKVGSIF
ncbi:autophagy-related protein [Pyronema omphalodes]|nr:autophagy-related protein [Pyronema omphalodes]